MKTVSTRRVAESTAVVCMVVEMGSNVLRVSCSDFDVFYIEVLQKIHKDTIIQHNCLHCLSVCVDSTENIKLSLSSLANMRVAVGGTVGACMIVIIGAAFAVFVIRLT